MRSWPGRSSRRAAFVLRLGHSVGEERQRLRWIGGGLGLAVCLGAVGAFSWGVFPTPVLHAIALLALPVGTAVAILKYRLYELDLVVNRALVYGVMTVGVVAAYVVVVGLIGATLSHGGSLVLSLTLTGVVAVGFQPVREQRFVNELMYVRRAGRSYVALAPRPPARELLGADAVLPTVVEKRSARPCGCRTSRSRSAAATTSQPCTATRRGPTPLSARASRPGRRRAPARAEVGWLREADRRLIADLAPQVAAAVHAVGLSESSRPRAAAWSSYAKKSVAGSAATYTTAWGRRLLASRSRSTRCTTSPPPTERANALLASATEQTQAMIGDVRRLIYGLRPPALDELGLVESLRGIASRETSVPITVIVEAPEALPPLPRPSRSLPTASCKRR